MPVRSSRRNPADRGETLIEVVLTVVVIGITVTALVAALATATKAAKSHRTDVIADVTMRNYAEATRDAARACTPGATLAVPYSPPTGFAVSLSPADPTCPAVDTTLLVTLSVATPTGVTDTMQLRVRTP